MEDEENIEQRTPNVEGREDEQASENETHEAHRLLAASVGTAFIGDYQAMAILACCFGGMLMWEAERHNAPQALAPDEALAEPAR